MTQALWDAALEALHSEMTQAGMSAEDVNAFTVNHRAYYRVLRFAGDPLVTVQTPGELTRAGITMAWAYRRGLTGR